MVSASTDGWVKIWDTHMFVCVQVIADDATAVADIGNWGGNSMRAGVQRVGQPSYEPFRCRRRRRRHGAKAQHHNRISLQFAVPTAVCCCKRQLAVLRRAAAGEV